MTHKALSKVFPAHFDTQGGINRGCKHIERLLKYEWTWKYLYHVYRGTVKPSHKLIRKLKSLKPPTPPRQRQRHRMIIEAKSLKQFKAWQILTMDEKRHALDREVTLRRIK